MVLVLLLGFIAGAASLFVFHKSNLKKLSRKLLQNLDQLGQGTIKKNEEKLPEEFSLVVSTLETIVNKQKEKIKPTKVNPEENDKSISLQKKIDNLYLVNELGQNVTSSLNLQQTFKHLYTTINSMMDAAVLELSVYNEASNSFKIFSNLEQLEGPTQPAYLNHFSEWCFKNKREVFLADAEHDFGRYVFKPLVLPDGRMARSVIAFPILDNEVITGTLCVMSFQKNRFEEYHRGIIRLLLGYISVAIQNAITHEELNLTKIRAEQSEKFKEQFLANMSHEIRTPINAVTGMTHLLLAKQPRPEQLRYLESIRNASDALLVIINDILDLSKIEAGKIELEKIGFSIDDLVENVREIMHFKTEERGLSFHVMRDPKIPPVLVGDPTRVTQILINLVGNAIKFTEKGSVSIRVSHAGPVGAETDGAGRIRVLFEVEDTGIGIPKEQQAKLFRDYSQASPETARKYGGTGLGLSISRQLVSLQGGEIGVVSTEGKGTCFHFSLIFPVSTETVAPQRKQGVSKEMLAKLRGLRILLADDNEYNRIVVREMLFLYIKDIHIDEALDGQEAIDLLRKNEYDLVLMDLVMPHLDGLEATLKIRNEFPEPIRNVPILALTASVVRSEIEKCLAAGMNGFIPKPFKLAELFGPMYRAISGQEAAVFSESKVSNQEKKNGRLVDWDLLDENAEGDVVRRKRFLELFIDKTPPGLASLANAMESHDLESIRIVAHSMKPQLLFTGITAAADLVERIETVCLEKKNTEQLPSLIEELQGLCTKAMEEVKEKINQ